jgi:hypothetical protein
MALKERGLSNFDLLTESPLRNHPATASHYNPMYDVHGLSDDPSAGHSLTR